jgi:hypothetical protein
MKCYHNNLLFFIQILQLFLGNKNFPLLKFGKENIHKSGLMKLLACHIFSDDLYVEPDIQQDIRPDIRYPALPYIRPDIRDPAFRLAGYPAGRISGQISIRCIPINNQHGPFLQL